MSETNLDQLDVSLKRHLADVLDGQIGRAGAGFLEHLQREAASGVRRRWPYGWAAGLVGAALAASIAVVMVMPLLDGPRKNDTPDTGHSTEMIPPLAKAALPVEQFVNYRTVDGGTVVVGDGVPARVLRRQRVHQVRWFDPESGARMEMTVPHEDVTFMELDTY